MRLRNTDSSSSHLTVLLDEVIPSLVLGSYEDVQSGELDLTGYATSTVHVIFAPGSANMGVLAEYSQDSGKTWKSLRSSLIPDAYELKDKWRIRFTVFVTTHKGVQQTPAGSITVKVLGFVDATEIN